MTGRYTSSLDLRLALIITAHAIAQPARGIAVLHSHAPWV